MTLSPIDLSAAFPLASEAAWTSEAQKALKGAPMERLLTRTADGHSLKALYTRADLMDGDLALPSGPAAGAFDARQIFAHPDPAESNREIRHELMRGVTSVMLRLDLVARSGDLNRPAGEGGLLVRGPRDLSAALAEIDLVAAPLQLEAGLATAAAAEALLASAPGGARLFLGHDALAALAAYGRSRARLDDALAEGAALAARCANSFEGARAIGIDARPYHNAGASEGLELGCALSAGVHYLRVLTKSGLTLAAAARQMAFTLVADQDFFLSIAKLRAFRLLWACVLEASGAGEAAPSTYVHAVTSSRMMSERDVTVNILRSGAAAFAAALGQADAITILPHTARLGLPTPAARRLARNMHILLMEEAHAVRVADPARGAFAFEAITRDLAGAAWREFQALEAEGGLGAALTSGALGKRIDTQWAERRSAIARRKAAITGVSEFADLAERVPETLAVDLAAIARRCESGGAIETALRGLALQERPALPMRRLAGDFEALRAAADSGARAGKSPLIALIPIGREADFSARINFAKSLFEAGGIAALVQPAETAADAAARFLDSGARLACLCSSDALYAEHGADYARAVKSAGCRFLYLAGKPGEAERPLRDAGIDDFVFAGQDAVAVLTRAHTNLGL